MSNSRSIDVAIAALALLNSAPKQTTFGAQTFTAVRAYRPVLDLENPADQALKVTVMPATISESPMTRGMVQGLAGIDVAIQKFVSGDLTQQVADCDPLMLLVQQIKQALEAAGALVLADAPTDCGWQQTQNNPIYDPVHLTTLNVFTSVPRFTYLVRRAR